MGKKRGIFKALKDKPIEFNGSNRLLTMFILLSKGVPMILEMFPTYFQEIHRGVF